MLLRIDYLLKFICDYFLQVWAGPLSGNRLVVACWNRCSKAATITARWDVLGLESNTHVSIRDLWQVSKLTFQLVFWLKELKLRLTFCVRRRSYQKVYRVYKTASNSPNALPPFITNTLIPSNVC